MKRTSKAMAITAAAMLAGAVAAPALAEEDQDQHALNIRRFADPTGHSWSAVCGHCKLDFWR